MEGKKLIIFFFFFCVKIKITYCSLFGSFSLVRGLRPWTLSHKKIALKFSNSHNYPYLGPPQLMQIEYIKILTIFFFNLNLFFYLFFIFFYFFIFYNCLCGCGGSNP